ncbi:hypothetical protein [Prochlorothrix hollandica]|uniref:hypothetical protein n=1 Tax=Prochlorothrix hollandica TaxID=1223 RepID=UPI00034A60CC|nr:hypothetical protein [Prochlorothrix hollandica]
MNLIGALSPLFSVQFLPIFPATPEQNSSPFPLNLSLFSAPTSTPPLAIQTLQTDISQGVPDRGSWVVRMQQGILAIQRGSGRRELALGL